MNRKTILACALLLAAVTASVLNAAEGDSYTVLDASSLRNGPDSAYASVATLSAGERVVEVARKGEWIKVRTTSGQQVGWLYGASVEKLPETNIATTVIKKQSPDITVRNTIDTAVAAVPVPAPQTPAATMLWEDAVFGRGEGGPAVVSAQGSIPEPARPAASASVVSATKSISESKAVPPVEGGNAGALGVVVQNKTQTVMAADVFSEHQVRPEIPLPESTVADASPELAVEKTLPAAAGAGSGLQVEISNMPAEPVAVATPDPAEKVTLNDTVKGPLIKKEAAAVIATGPPVTNGLSMPAPISPAENLYRFTRNAKLRAGPGAKYDVVSWGGVDSYASEMDRQGDWIRVKMQVSQRIGWVYKASLMETGSVPSVVTANVPGPASADELAMGGDGSRSQVTMVDTQVEPVAVATPNLTEKPLSGDAVNDVSVMPEAVTEKEAEPVLVKTLRPAPSASPAENLYRFTRNAKLRAGPDTKYDIVGWGGVDSYASELKREGSWLKIQMQVSKHIGWVFKSSLTLVQAAAPSAVAEQAVTVPPLLADKVIVLSPLAEDRHEAVAAPPVSVLQPLTPSKISAAANPDSQQILPDTEHVIHRTTLIRTGPGALFDVLGWAGLGASIVALEQQGEWMKVRMKESGRTGWVEAASLQLPAPAAVAEKTAEPVQIETISPAAPISPAENLYRFNRNAKLRAGPDDKYDIVGYGGVDAYASELKQEGDWIRVKMQVSQRIGWVFKSSLTLAKAAATAVAEQVAVSTERGAFMASPLLDALQGASVVDKNVSPRPEVIALKSVESGAEKTVAGAGQLYFFSQTSDLLAGPGRQFDRVGWVGRNESATVIDSKGEWRRVNITISGKRGWVPASLLLVALATGEVVVDADKNAPAVKADGKEVAAFTQLLPARIVKTATLRSRASLDSDMTGWVAKGDMVVVLEKQGGWMRVNPQLAGKQGGWIRADYLRTIEPPMAANTVGGAQPASAYNDRISHGEAFNFSYAALEQALYRIPIEEIEIIIGEDDLKALFRKGTYDKSAFPIDIIQDKRKLTGTVQVLGSSTRVFRKKSLQIKLDKEGARWFGRRYIALRSMGSDKAMMREWISWKLFAAMGMKVPEVHFTRVRFNHGEKVALYLSIEWMGKEFFVSNGLDPKGEFYQPNDAAHCGDLYTAEHMDICFDKITPEDGDFSSISSMGKAIIDASAENMDQVLAEYFDDESVLNWITGNALVTNGDTYNKNYWMYHQPDGGKWTMVPWDYNLTFGRTYDPYAITPFTIFNENFQYYYAPDVGAGNPLKDKALRNPKLRARIEAKLKHLTGMEPNGPEDTFGWFSPTVMEARIGNMAAVVGKEVYKDTFLSYGEEDFTKTYESMMHYTKAHDYFLKYKLFGQFHWSPEPPNQPLVNFPLPQELVGQGVIKAGADHTHLVDPGWGYFVADLNLGRPLNTDSEFKVIVEGGAAPRYLPPTQSASRCIQRSWTVSAETPGTDVQGDVMFEYIQENSHRTEVPQTLHEELLELWMLDGNRWKPIKTEVNQYSNTLTARGLDVKYGQARRFVACSPF